MAEESKKQEHNEKDFGEGIEVVKEKSGEEKDIEINFGKVFSLFGKKDKAEAAAPPQQATHKHHHAAHKPEPKEKGDEEVDLGKMAAGIKGMFKGSKEPKENHAGKSEDEVSFNAKAAADFLSKRGAAILLIIGILISMGLTAQVRLEVSGLPFTTQWAKNNVNNVIQSDIGSAISAQYPNLPDERKGQIMADEMAKAAKSGTYQFKTGQYTGQSIKIDDQVKATAEVIKDFYRDGEGRPYSSDIDPYYWYRYAENIIQKGHIWDEQRNGVPWDNRQLAPLGRPILPEDTFFPNFLATLYKFGRIFNHSATLWSVQTLFYPALITALTVLFVFLICRKIAGNIGGFFGSIMAGLHGAYVERTVRGDNDAAVIFLAIFTLWLFIEAIYARKALWRWGLAAAAGLAAAVFSIAWGGWYFILLFILAASAATVAAGVAKSLADSLAKGQSPGAAIIGAAKSAFTTTAGRQFTIPTIIFLISTGLFVGIFTDFNRFTSIPTLAFGISKLKTAVLSQSYWPNVLTTVAELNPGSFNQVVSKIQPGIFGIAASSVVALLSYAITMLALPFSASRHKDDRTIVAVIAAVASGLVVFIAAVALNFMAHGLPSSFWLWTLIAMASGAGATAISIIMLTDKLRSDDTKILYSVFFATLITVWFISTIYASTKGIRFVLLLAPAVGIGFGIMLGLTGKLAAWANENFLKINKTALALFIFAILALSTYSTDITKTANNIARNDVPIINDAWYGALSAIKDDSNSTAIITSWWDFGHHFKQITDRRVTFDGTTQQGPQAHWVGKFFMTRDETEAAGILRMLDCGSNTAWDAVNSVRNDFAGSVKILYRITAMPSRAEAEKTLVNEYGFNQAQATNITNNTHCEPSEGYIIASDDMIGKSGVWAHFGSWDFEKAIIYQTLRGKAEKEAVTEMKKMFNYSDEKAKSLYNEVKRINSDSEANTWIAPWPSFASDVSGCSIFANTENEQEKIVQCGNGLVVNLSTSEAYFPAQGGKNLHPVSFVYLSNSTGTERVMEKFYANDTVPQRLSVILIPQGSGYASVLATPEIAGGMYTKMFYFGGRGLTHFKLLTHQTGLTGTNVYVYKADWDSLK